MIKNAKKNAVRKPRVTVLADVHLTRVAGGDPLTKIKEALVGD